MNSIPKFFSLLLNMYINLSICSVGWQEIEQFVTSQAAIPAFYISTPGTIATEKKIDKLMEEYLAKLSEIRQIKEDKKAIVAMQQAREIWLQQAQVLACELEAETNTLSEQEAAAIKEKLLLKPYFKQINDACIHYLLSGRFETNPELKKSFLAMDEFLTVLYR